MASEPFPGHSMFELEQRVLYDASPLAVVLPPDVIDTGEPTDLAEFVFDQDNNAATAADFHADTVEDVVTDELISIDAQFNSESDLATSDDNASQLVVIDSGVADYQQLISGLDPSTHVLLLDANQSGIEQISQALQSSNQTFDAIHIVSHGTDGSVQLGNQRLDSDSLPGVASELSQWTHWLSSDADVLFYGCNLAETESGEEFIESIATLTGADVVASDDITGNSDLGGDWDLEYAVGEIDTDVVFSTVVQQAWMGTLETFTVDTLADVVDAERWGDFTT